ncbi:MAG: hypothetical protein MJZ84_04345 [Paludibacteraceae bacterium]|nr:hypothetical protein [Paludibacteraceae bacterium]
MRVIVDSQIEETLWAFYEEAMCLHPTLDMTTVVNKINRLRGELNALGDFPDKYPLAKKVEWQLRGYREFVYEDIHLGYKVIKLGETKESVVYVAEACHSLLYHD